MKLVTVLSLFGKFKAVIIYEQNRITKDQLCKFEPQSVNWNTLPCHNIWAIILSTGATSGASPGSPGGSEALMRRRLKHQMWRDLILYNCRQTTHEQVQQGQENPVQAQQKLTKSKWNHHFTLHQKFRCRNTNQKKLK